MDKPKLGDTVRLVGRAADTGFEIGRVFEVHDQIDVWWDTAYGENKMGLMDEYSEAELAKADWFAQVENVQGYGETMAVASWEVIAL